MERRARIADSAVGKGLVLGGVAVTLVLCLYGVLWGGPDTGDHLWNLRENGDDRFDSNEAWLRPWRHNYEDGWGQWVGNYTYEVCWGAVSAVGNADGSFTHARSRDYQFHAWTYVYCETASTISFWGSGDCVPRVFLRYNFNNPLEFTATLNLNAGWNRIDITGYNQNAGYEFRCGPLADLVDMMDSDSTVARPPVADAGGPYQGLEGTAIDFDASGSHDPDGDALEYCWDFDNDGTCDTEWSSDPTSSHVWGDDWNGNVVVMVRDGQFTVSASADLTVSNIDPTAVIESVQQPNPHIILPRHRLTFTGSFADPGWLDTHTFTWDFGDGASEQGTPEEENDPPDATGTCLVRHAFGERGTYLVTLTIADDDGGLGVSQPWPVTVLGPGKATEELDNYIQNLPDSAFDGPAGNRREALHNKFEVLLAAINDGQYDDAIDKLLHDIRAKADGSVDGNPKDDWITDPVAQHDICAMIDDIVAYLETL